MKIEIKKLTLQNFKGARDLTVEFANRTDISGMNAIGKTRLFDAFTFLFFGKDSEDNEDFSKKTLDTNNEPIHRVDCSVTGILSIDDIDTKFERIYKEKWVKKRGEESPEFSGHETIYFVNGVPHLAKEYQEKVKSILPESLFKQLTNPAYFNSMKWTDRREMLFKMAGNVTDQDIIIANPDLKSFYNLITGKSFDNFKKELAAKKKLLKESIQDIPARIDEISRTIVADPDYKQIVKDITGHNVRLSEIEKLINSDAEKFNAANQANQEKQNKMFGLTQKINDLVFNDQDKRNQRDNEIKLQKSNLTNLISNHNQTIFRLKVTNKERQKRIDWLNSDNNILREKWNTINASQLIFNEDEFKCPACSRSFESEDIEAKKAEMTTSFNNDKTTKLARITELGQANKEEIETLEIEIANKITEIGANKLTIKTIQNQLDAIVIPEVITVIPDPQIKILQDEREKIEKSIVSIEKVDNSELINEKQLINTSLDVLKKQLDIKEQNEKRQVRKQELIDQEKSLAQQIANLEKQEFQCEAFTRAKINMTENKVNSMFTLVRFKMFNNLINGGTEETCEALINGVPYADANNAARINAGLDIINVLSKHFDCYAPVFIDNAEAVNELIETNSQMIKLFVTTDKELIVKNN